MKKKIISLMLALLMVCGTLSVFCMTGMVAAADGDSTTDTPTETPTEEKYVAIVKAALTQNYENPQDKIDSDENMRLAAQYNRYELYVNDYTGEIAFKDTVSGQILLSNPYSIQNDGTTAISDTTRASLLSQIVVGFKENGVAKTFYSYTEAASRGQINVRNIRNGIRVEYALGREDANYLAPGRIVAERMTSLILSKIDPTLVDKYVAYKLQNGLEITGNEASELPYSFIVGTGSDGKTNGNYDAISFVAYYTFVNPYETDENGNYVMADKAIAEIETKYPVFKTLAAKGYTHGMYIRADATTRDKRMLEKTIKTYCPEYNYDEMEKDHTLTEFVSDELDPPLFKMSLEYTIADEGLTIRLPANGIRFDSELYSLEYVSPLQYFGAGDVREDGYLFYPDGSGAIFYYSDLKGKNGNIAGKVYGIDYAYHTISGGHLETIRMPVFGALNTVTTKLKDADGNIVTVKDEDGNEHPVIIDSQTSGYLAVLEEGDAMANITAAWDGSKHYFASVYTTFFPRPKDSYKLDSSIAVGSNSTWDVEASRKYTGSYKMRIYMMSDENQKSTLEAAEGRSYYEPTYVGMANAYRHYLTDVAGVLTALTDVKDGELPLYIESFGTVPDVERVLSIPINVDVPLTTFDDVQKMYEEISKFGITNVQFKLTGFANHGMYYTYPTKLKWMKEVGGSGGFENLLADARENGYGVYPDFDFMYITNQRIFDGINLKTAAARTIDNRYAGKQIYTAIDQEFVKSYDICVTPAMIEQFYVKFSGAFKGYNPIGISVATLGSDLNSDFGDKNPTNREDAKKIISDIFANLSKDYRGSVMTSGGNIYVLQHTKHLLNAAVDSSRFASASRSVPFVGMVLHGYMNFAGSAINMAGNVNYQVLKAIENGASVYFTLSYRNTSLLKEFTDLSDYYSVNYMIWAGKFDDDGNLIEPGELFTVYNRVNDAIGHLQTKKIVDHRFLIGERVPTESEKAADAKYVEQLFEELKSAAISAEKAKLVAEYRRLYEAGEIGAGKVIEVIVDDEEIRKQLSVVYDQLITDSDALAPSDEYRHTKYTLDDGLIVMVTYEGGTSFILNYNVYAVTVTLDGVTYTIDSYGYQTITR